MRQFWWFSNLPVFSSHLLFKGWANVNLLKFGSRNISSKNTSCLRKFYFSNCSTNSSGHFPWDHRHSGSFSPFRQIQLFQVAHLFKKYCIRESGAKKKPKGPPKLNGISGMSKAQTFLECTVSSNTKKINDRKKERKENSIVSGSIDSCDSRTLLHSWLKPRMWKTSFAGACELVVLHSRHN